ncbi:MAG: NlpC/P60 family protein [Roseovarius sp.]|nr:NlpC/P60 family protein [Roseovarius sp.]
MSDPRLTPANGRVAAVHLRDRVKADIYVDGTPMRVCVPLADLLRAPLGARDRQLLLGEDVTCYEQHDGWAFVQSAKDGYVGYLPVTELTLQDADDTPNHRVIARTTHVYPKANFKTRELSSVSHGSRVNVLADHGRFAQTPLGFIPTAHLAPLTQVESDPVRVAETFLGTPYLWGGNSGFGLDCSALVQAACLACGLPCPGDSDMQETELGTHLPRDAALQRGDLLFWTGHVAWVADPGTLLHANAFHMAVAHEPLQDAIQRIEAQGDGPVTARKRLGEIT